MSLSVTWHVSSHVKGGFTKVFLRTWHVGGYPGTGTAAFQAASDPAPEDSRYFQPNAEARQASGMDPATSDPLIAMQNPAYLMADYQATHNLGASQHQVGDPGRPLHNPPLPESWMWPLKKCGRDQWVQHGVVFSEESLGGPSGAVGLAGYDVWSTGQWGLYPASGGWEGGGQGVMGGPAGRKGHVRCCSLIRQKY